jgi:hypothetical protein
MLLPGEHCPRIAILVTLLQTMPTVDFFKIHGPKTFPEKKRFSNFKRARLKQAILVFTTLSTRISIFAVHKIKINGLKPISFSSSPSRFFPIKSVRASIRFPPKQSKP